MIPEACDLAKQNEIRKRARIVEKLLKNPKTRARIEHYINSIWVSFDLKEKEPIVHITNLWTFLDTIQKRS